MIQPKNTRGRPGFWAMPESESEWPGHELGQCAAPAPTCIQTSILADNYYFIWTNPAAVRAGSVQAHTCTLSELYY